MTHYNPRGPSRSGFSIAPHKMRSLRDKIAYLESTLDASGAPMSDFDIERGLRKNKRNKLKIKARTNKIVKYCRSVDSQFVWPKQDMPSSPPK